MPESVKLIECPRDAWQGLKGQIPAFIKADYLKALISAGFKHIDAASFVSPKAVPQMADSELVLEYLDPPDDVEIIGILVNAKGAERAVKTGSVQTLGFPYSISPSFLQRNQNQTPEESLEALEQVTDPRARRGIRHSIASTLAMVVAAGLSGCGRSFRSAGDFAADLPQEALARLLEDGAPLRAGGQRVDLKLARWDGR